MSKTRKCPNCGANVPKSMRFCGSCGTPLDEEEEFIPDLPRPIRKPNEPRPVETAIRPEKRRGAKRETWQYVLVFAIIAVVIAIAVILVIKMNQPADMREPSENFETVHVINAEGEEISSTAAPEQTAAATDAPENTDAPEKTAEPEPTDTPEPTAAPEAFAVQEVSDTVYVTGNGVNLRSGPGTSYEVLSIVSAGTALTRTGTTGNSWSRVMYNGKECYISNALVTTEEPKTTAAPSTPAPYDVSAADDTVVVTEEANIRKGPGTNYDVIAVLPANTELKRTGTTGGWSRIVYNGSEAFIADSLIKVKGSNELEEKTGKLTVTMEANLREGPSTDDQILGIAKVGAELNMTGKIGSWYRVEYEGKTAYINANLVKES